MKVRGQVSSIDVMIASIVFVLIFVSIRGVWLDNVGSAQETFFLSEMQLHSEAALDSLVKTQGYPAQWSANNVELIGLADKPLVLNPAKVAAFAQLSNSNYDSVSALLDLGKYDFNFSLVAANGAVLASAGVPVDANAFSISLKRTVMYNGGVADVVFRVFSK